MFRRREKLAKGFCYLCVGEKRSVERGTRHSDLRVMRDKQKFAVPLLKKNVLIYCKILNTLFRDGEEVGNGKHMLLP